MSDSHPVVIHHEKGLSVFCVSIGVCWCKGMVQCVNVSSQVYLCKGMAQCVNVSSEVCWCRMVQCVNVSSQVQDGSVC